MKSLLFLIATCSSSAYSSELHMNYNSYDSHDNYWKITPEIIICKNQTVFSKKQIEYALDVWGEKYSKISIKEKCNYKVEYGKIKITDGKHLKPKMWGHTEYFYKERTVNEQTVREHDSALVQLDRNVTDIKLLIHELGHAFGYDHYNQRKDVMNSSANYNITGNYPY